jgi:hypothetical protein
MFSMAWARRLLIVPAIDAAE